MVERLVGIQPTSKILMVEGPDDKHLVYQFCRRHESVFTVHRSGDDVSVTLRNQATDFEILDIGNRSELLGLIRTAVEGSDRPVVGILVDADANFQNCWNEIVNSFNRTAIKLPQSPCPTGTIIREQQFSPRIGIWIMPNNGSRGEIENFVLEMMPANDTVWPSSQNYIDDIPQCERKFTSDKVDKAKLHAWLATRREPGRMGAAVGDGDLEVDGHQCQNFLSWLTRLFG